MSNHFILEKVPYYSQRDNRYKPFVSCFPTSMAMAIEYCLNLVDKNKSDIGCHRATQLEDYLNELIYDNETKQWMKKNQGRLGSWIWKYARRTIYMIEAYIFNKIMNEHGYKAEYKQITYDEYCTRIEENKLPIVVGGNFKAVSRVGGHVCCGIGFDKSGMKELIVRDPFGDALKGYPKGKSQEQNDNDGYENAYGLRFYKNGKFASIVIERV